MPPPHKAGCLLLAGLWRQICLNAFIVSRGGRDAEREMWPSAEGRHRGGSWRWFILCGLVPKTDALTSEFKPPLASVRGGEAPAADRRQEENMAPLPAFCEAVQPFRGPSLNCDPSGVGERLVASAACGSNAPVPKPRGVQCPAGPGRFCSPSGPHTGRRRSSLLKGRGRGAADGPVERFV